MPSSGYVGEFLTHFLGRRLNEEERYILLKDRILGPGVLMYPPFDGTGIRSIGINVLGRVSKNEIIQEQFICFCDIPTNQLSIHISKYGNFGLSFERSFLLKQSATPVFYVATNSNCPIQNMLFAIPSSLADEMRTRGSDGTLGRGLYYDAIFPGITLPWACLYELVTGTSTSRPEEIAQSGLSPEQVRASQLNILKNFTGLDEGNLNILIAILKSSPGFPHIMKSFEDFLIEAVFGFLKGFDATLPEDDPDNYYMEREWRVPAYVHFSLNDVKEIVLPEKFLGRFKADFPGYTGRFYDAEANKPLT